MLELSNPRLYDTNNNNTGATQQSTSSKNTEDTVTYRRVQEGNGNNASQVRIEVNPDGTISIPNKDANLNILVR